MVEWVYTPNALMPEGATFPQGVSRYAAVVEYDGSRYSGWQRQNHSPSVQACVEAALSKVANQSLSVACAGRTDSGVHGTFQVIHWDTSARRECGNWLKGANVNLPSDIKLQWVGRVNEEFHARFSATARTYRYIVCNTPQKPAILNGGVTWEPKPLDIDAMNAACPALLGEQDYSAFRAAGCQSRSHFRNVTAARWQRVGSYLVFEITANAFLLHMVRNIVGSMLEVGRGRQSSTWISELLQSADRTLAAPTAPPNGLYLVGVDYPPGYDLPPSPTGPLTFGC